MSSGKKHCRAEPKFNVSIINEVKSVICVETLNMISNKSMEVKKQHAECYKIYHGAVGTVMGQAEQFMKAGSTQSVYSNMWVLEQTKSGNRYVVPEHLHQQYGKVMVCGDNITEDLIRRLYDNKPESRLNGKTIIARARLAMREAKKMDSLLKDAVRARVLEKTANGEYGFPSGRNEDDFDNWMLKKMFNWDKLFGASGGEDDDNEEDDGIDLNESKEEEGGGFQKLMTPSATTMERMMMATLPQRQYLQRTATMMIPRRNHLPIIYPKVGFCSKHVVQ